MPDEPVNERAAAPQDRAELTSMHLRRAIDGDAPSLAWLVARLSPLLRAQATHRLGTTLGAIYDPDDIVDEAWSIALPRLSTLRPRGGRHTPVLLRFLATTVRNRVMTLARRHLTRDPLTRTEPGSEGCGTDDLPAEATGVVTRAARRELHDKVTACLHELDDRDREVIVLRGIEQLDGKAVAVLLGISPEAVATRFCRALARLRARLPGGIFDELGEAMR